MSTLNGMKDVRGCIPMDNEELVLELVNRGMYHTFIVQEYAGSRKYVCHYNITIDECGCILASCLCGRDFTIRHPTCEYLPELELEAEADNE